MKKIYWLVLATTVAIAGCGKTGISEKTQIVSDCSLNGGGEYKCNYKNKGNAKGTLCEHFVLKANPGHQRNFRIYFADDSLRAIVEPSRSSSRAMDEYILKSKGRLEGPSAEDKDRDEKSMLSSKADYEPLERKWIDGVMQSVKNSGENLDKYITDHRVALAVQVFEMDHKGISQTEVCSGIVEAGDVKEVNGLAQFGSERLSPVDACFNPYEDRKWSDACGFVTIPVAEIDKLVKAKLESTPPK